MALHDGKNLLLILGSQVTDNDDRNVMFAPQEAIGLNEAREGFMGQVAGDAQDESFRKTVLGQKSFSFLLRKLNRLKKIVVNGFGNHGDFWLGNSVEPH